MFYNNLCSPFPARRELRASTEVALNKPIYLFLAWALPALALSAAVPTLAVAAAPPVVVSVKPVHSLVAGVMEGIAAPRLLITGGASPHTYSLKPSDARALAHAKIVFVVGGALESFLGKALGALVQGGRLVELTALPGLAPAGRAGRGRGSMDPHIWLDVANAKVIVATAARVLEDADAANGRHYAANAKRLLARLDGLDAELARLMAPVKDIPYVVFHDAYGHFERRYGLAAAAALTVNPARPPGARHLGEVRRTMVAVGVRCAFGEPQFRPALIDTLIEDTAVKVGVLDALGAAVPPGPDAYFRIMRDLARALAGCLSD